MIGLAKYEDLNTVSLLMQDVFEKKMKASYSSQGQECFSGLISLSAIQKRFLEGNLFYISIDDTDIKGVLEIEKPCHIAFLFIHEEGQGLGKELCSFALKESAELLCTVGAFKESIGFYKALGFVEVAKENTTQVMQFTLMAKSLQ